RIRNRRLGMTSQSSTLSSQPSIQLHIERLVFDDLSVASSETALVQAAVEGELGRLLASKLFAPALSFAAARVAAGEIHIHPGTTARDLGVEIGQSVFRSLIQSGLAGGSRRGPVRGVVSTDRRVGVDLDDFYNNYLTRK